MKRLLLAYDDSECSRMVIGELAFAGLPDRLDVRVLSVADVWLPKEGEVSPVTEKDLPENIRRARARGKGVLDEHGQLAASAVTELASHYPNWDLQAQTSAGSPSFTIVRQAAEWHADLILLGAHSRGPLQRFFLGSVAQTVAANASCSVHICRPRGLAQGRPLRIMVAVDGSADADLAIQAVVDRCWPPATSFHIVSVLDPRLETLASRPTLYADDWINQHDANAGEWLCRVTDRATWELKNESKDVEEHILEGDPKQRLIQHADDWGADCLFLGARGMDHGKRRYLGSTAAALAIRAHCSVEIVRCA